MGNSKLMIKSSKIKQLKSATRKSQSLSKNNEYLYISDKHIINLFIKLNLDHYTVISSAKPYTVDYAGVYVNRKEYNKIIMVKEIIEQNVTYHNCRVDIRDNYIKGLINFSDIRLISTVRKSTEMYLIINELIKQFYQIPENKQNEIITEYQISNL
jgi:hypothetical protein